MDLNKHIVTDDNQHFHSSGIARVANGNRIGSVSTISFEKRQQIEKNRQKIGSYNRSVIGNYRSVPRTDLKADNPIKDIKKTSDSLQKHNSIIKPRRFSDSPPRGYNPFS